MIKELLSKVNEMMKPHVVYAVGGCVRDYILGVTPKDYDFCTVAEPDVIEKCIKSKSIRAYLTGKKFGTIGCKIDGEMIEITTFRTEVYIEGSRKPEVVYVKSLTEDLSRRDFTINAMAMRLDKNGEVKIIDPFGGRDDLTNGLIRCVGIPKHRFKEDPLRMLRAVRFACHCDFRIEDKTKKKIKSMAIKILDISKERWMMELDKILVSDFVLFGLMDLWNLDLFKFMIPELHLQYGYEQNSRYHDYSLCTHTRLVVEACPNDLNLRWAALLHDIAKPFVRSDKEIIIGGDGVETKSNYIGHAELGGEIVEKIALYLKWSKLRRDIVKELVKDHLSEGSKLREYDNKCKRRRVEDDKKDD